MKTNPLRVFFLTIGSLLVTTNALVAAPFTITGDFIAYMKETTNPHEFGLKDDGRFYPYSTPLGRRIGYDQPVADKQLFARGLAKTDAEAQLRENIARALAEVKAHVEKKFPARAFDSLGRKSQEILVDYAFSEGVKNLPADFFETVMSENWDKLFNTFMYIRWIEKGWPDTKKNKAFADRWLDPQSRLRPPERSQPHESRQSHAPGTPGSSPE